MPTTILLIAVVVIPLFFVIVTAIKRNNEEWTGVLENKKIITHRSRRKRTKFMMYFSNDLGKKVVYNVADATYNSINVGDKVEKIKGQLDPVRITKKWE